jgi:uncharacterized protein YxjI
MADKLELDWKGRTPAEARGQEAPTVVESGAGRGMPGDARHMSLELRTSLSGLLEGPGLRVRQLKEWAEILVGWETHNRYEACDLDGRPVVYIGETGEGWGNALLRNLWPFRRIRLECMTLGGVLALAMERPWTLFFSRMEVQAWDGRALGYIQQRFGLLRRTFDLCTPAGVVLATLEGPIWKPWTFHIRQRGTEVATIRKQWSGLGTEVFSNADNFGVEFQPELTDARLRQLVLAATLLVDFSYFERRNGGLMDVLNVLNLFD